MNWPKTPALFDQLVYPIKMFQFFFGQAKHVCDQIGKVGVEGDKRDGICSCFLFAPSVVRQNLIDVFLYYVYPPGVCRQFQS